MRNSYRIEAVVLKRIKYGEADRIVTLFTKDHGKLVVIAKGVRKLTSKRMGSLEVGTKLIAEVIKGKGMDILSQTMIINSYQAVKQDLVSLTQLYQLLEVVDVLTREEQELPEIFEVLDRTLTQLTETNRRKTILLDAFQEITELLGFTPPQIMSELTLKSYIETIADRKLNSKDFLSPGKI